MCMKLTIMPGVVGLKEGVSKIEMVHPLVEMLA